MLYMTTRDNRDAYTAHKALSDSVAPDGGLYIPYRLASFGDEVSSGFASAGFGETVARILNLFFSSRLNGWDVDVCIGRNPLKIVPVGRKTVAVEAWHNPGRSFSYAVSSLNDKLLQESNSKVQSWTKIALRIAYYFAVYGELLRNGTLATEEQFDVSVAMGDFTDPAAIFYAKRMGLPVSKIIVCARENSAVWDLINHGQIGTSLLRPEQKLGMERLICGLFGHEEVAKYHAACERHGVYTVPEELLTILPEALFGAVVGKEREGSVISNVFKSSGYLLAPETAVCYGGVQDFRAKTGQGKMAIFLAETDPMSSLEEISKVSGLPADSFVPGR